MIISQVAYMIMLLTLVLTCYFAVKERSIVMSAIAVILSWFIFIGAPNVVEYYVDPQGNLLTCACNWDIFGWLGFATGLIMFMHMILVYVTGGGKSA